ncbi:MAG: hypothetical protein JNG83_05000 [Opitutaceae bacterium]|nr:hypothetical protein [Opitutaceae bacterium]
MQFPSGGRPRAATSAAGLAALLALLLSGCVGPPLPTDRELVTTDPKLIGIPARDKVLWQYRLGLQALRAGRDAEARERLDDAILTMGGIITGTADAARARSLWAAEGAKTFIGEPYERAMAYYYRGILYWRDGQPDNARACFRSVQFLDSAAEDASYRGDYVLADYLDGLASVKLAADGADARARAEKSAGRELPEYDPAANVLVFAEWGRGPLKYADGQAGEKLRFNLADSAARRAVLTVAGQAVPLPPYDDLNFQATTRGGRVMDYILDRKAVFKDQAGTLGDVALTGAIVTHEVGRGEDKDKAALALAAIGLISKVASGAANASADTRAWDNLPQYLGFAALRLAPGEYPATLRFYSAEGRVLSAHTQELVIRVREGGAGDTVVFLSELAKNPQ